MKIEPVREWVTLCVDVSGRYLSEALRTELPLGTEALVIPLTSESIQALRRKMGRAISGCDFEQGGQDVKDAILAAIGITEEPC